MLKQINDTVKIAQNVASAFRSMARWAEAFDNTVQVASMSREDALEIVAEFEARENKRGKPSKALREARAILAGEATFDGYDATSTRYFASEACATDDDADKAERIYAACKTLAIKAARAQRLSADADLTPYAEVAQKLIDGLREVNPTAYAQWREGGGMRVIDDAEVAAVKNVDGFSQTASLKGRACETRYRDDREVRSNLRGAMVAAEDMSATAAMRQALRDMSEAGF